MMDKSYSLIFLSLAFVGMGLTVLVLNRLPGSTLFGAVSMALGGWGFLPWLLLDALLACFIQALLVHARPRLDMYLFPLSFFLSSVGLVMLSRLNPQLLTVQLRWLFIGLVVFLISLRMSRLLKNFAGYEYVLGLLCLFFLALPLFFGTEIGGSRNWLVLGSWRVQPSEFAKILLVLFLAAYLSAHRTVLVLPNQKTLFMYLPPLKYLLPLILIWGLAMAMFVLCRDLGTALVFYGVTVLMTYIATGRKTYIFLALVFLAVAAVLSYSIFGHVQVRFDIWLNPWQDPTGDAFQIVESLMAFAVGGVWGTGFSHGQPDVIPEATTDFIFAAIAEEFGLVGTLTIISCYALFFFRSMKLALSSRREDMTLLLAGVALVFSLEAFIIMSGVTKLLPLTGIALPFVSYGGSSMVSSFALLGVSLSAVKESAHG